MSLPIPSIARVHTSSALRAQPEDTFMQDLEERIAHLTRQVEDLSDVVARQADEITTLQRRVLRLMERAATAEASGGASVPLADQRPPHW